MYAQREVYNQGMQTEMIPDIYLSPGFYMGFWKACIENRFSPIQIKEHTKLQQHRELRVGAIVAAAITRQRRMQYFVGIPRSDPPDILLMHQKEITVNGKKGTEPEYIHLEVVRCNFDEGETILGQATIKNKPVYRNTTIAIDVTGTTNHISYKQAVIGLADLAKVYPAQFIAIEQIGVVGEAAYQPGVFRITQLYPSETVSHVRQIDEQAFFRTPTDVLGRATPARGVSTEWQDLGNFTLLPPTID